MVNNAFHTFCCHSLRLSTTFCLHFLYVLHFIQLIACTEGKHFIPLPYSGGKHYISLPCIGFGGKHYISLPCIGASTTFHCHAWGQALHFIAIYWGRPPDPSIRPGAPRLPRCTPLTCTVLVLPHHHHPHHHPQLPLVLPHNPLFTSLRPYHYTRVFCIK